MKAFKTLSSVFVLVSPVSSLHAQQTTTVTRVVDGDSLKGRYRGIVEKNIERLLNTNSCFGCELFYANPGGANLTNVYLMHSYLNGAGLINANLECADLINVYLSGANLKNVIDLTVEQLSRVKTLYKVKNLDPELMHQVKGKFPHLLEKPKEEESITDE
jgi:hypothetical protein